MRAVQAVRRPWDERAAGIGRPPAGTRAVVLMFLDNPRAVSSGRPRAVLARANALARQGYRVTLGVERYSRDAVREIARLRRGGNLHRAVAVHMFADTGAGPEEAAAVAAEPQASPPSPDYDQVRVGRGRLRRPARLEYLSKGAVVRVDRYDPAGRIAAIEVPGAAGTEAWQYDASGQLRQIETRGADGRPTRRRLVHAGRGPWLDVRLEGQLGENPASVLGRPGSLPWGAACAAWADRLVGDADRPVVFADGEAVSQRTLRAMRHPGVRGVFAVHNSHLEEPFTPDRPTLPWWRPYYADLTNVHGVAVLTERQRDHLADRYPRLPLFMIRYVPAARPPLFVRRRPIAVAVARLAHQKHLDELIDAFASVRPRAPLARLDIYGTGPDRADLEAYARDKGLAGVVRFRGFTTRPLRAFASGRVACMTSRTEGLPLVLGEAMGVGTPVLSYDTNYGPAEVIRDGVDGYVVPPRDVEAYGDRLAAILTDTELATRLQRGAREIARRFPLSEHARQWAAAVDALEAGEDVAAAVGA